MSLSADLPWQYMVTKGERLGSGMIKQYVPVTTKEKTNVNLYGTLL